MTIIAEPEPLILSRRDVCGDCGAWRRAEGARVKRCRNPSSPRVFMACTRDTAACQHFSRSEQLVLFGQAPAVPRSGATPGNPSST